MFFADGSDPILTGLGQLGVAGTILGILLMFGRQQLKRESERADANAAEVARLNTSIQEKYIPSLLDSQRALAESNVVLSEVKSSLAELRASAKGPAQRRRSDS